MSADDALASLGRDSPDLDALSQAKDFLREVLADGAVFAKEIDRQAKTRNLGWRTVEKAKHQLGINSEKRGHSWIWILPDEA